MKNYLNKLTCVMLALALLCCALPATAWAEATTTSATAATTTTAPATVSLEQLRVKGSNSKIYLSTPGLSDGVNAYSFNVPNWMEVATITFRGKEDMAATCSNGQSVVSTGVDYSVGVELKENKNTFTLSLSKDGKSRNIEVTINRKQIDCYIEDIMVYSGDNEIIPQGEAGDGAMSFTLPSGSLTGVTLRVKPRHENIVSIANITGMEENAQITADQKVKLTLNRYATYYPVDLTDHADLIKLVEGTNVYHVEVNAGDITRTCKVTVIVGDPAANAPTTTTTTTTTTAPTTTSTLASSLPTNGTLPQQGGSSGGSSMFGDIPTVLWILIGIIALVVIGSCIFMIVNMTSNNRRGGGYGGYDDYDYRPGPRRRNLTEYMDDYDDGYYDDGYGRGRGGRYDDYDRYNDYDQPPRRGGRYDSYNDYDSYDGYEQPSRRRYDDYDNYDGGDGGYGGY